MYPVPPPGPGERQGGGSVCVCACVHVCVRVCAGGWQGFAGQGSCRTTRPHAPCPCAFPVPAVPPATALQGPGLRLPRAAVPSPALSQGAWATPRVPPCHKAPCEALHEAPCRPWEGLLLGSCPWERLWLLPTMPGHGVPKGWRGHPVLWHGRGWWVHGIGGITLLSFPISL